jgi:hypothetical protein
MATSPGAGLSSSKSTNLTDLPKELYTQCLNRFPPEKLLFQQDLLKLKVIPNDSLEVLVQCAQALTNQNLFRVYTVNDRIAWRAVKEEDAAKYVLKETNLHPDSTTNLQQDTPTSLRRNAWCIPSSTLLQPREYGSSTSKPVPTYTKLL